MKNSIDTAFVRDFHQNSQAVSAAICMNGLTET